MGNLARHNRGAFPAIPSFFDDIFDKDWLNWPLSHKNRGSSVPAINVKETNDAYELEVAAPGMSKENFKVELDNHVLIISAEKEARQENQADQGGYTRQEFSYQSFVRTFTLPENLVKSDQIAARYKDGVLSISIPKTEEAKGKQPKLINISE